MPLLRGGPNLQGDGRQHVQGVLPAVGWLAAQRRPSPAAVSPRSAGAADLLPGLSGACELRGHVGAPVFRQFEPDELLCGRVECELGFPTIPRGRRAAIASCVPRD